MTLDMNSMLKGNHKGYQRCACGDEGKKYCFKSICVTWEDKLRERLLLQTLEKN